MHILACIWVFFFTRLYNLILRPETLKCDVLMSSTWTANYNILYITSNISLPTSSCHGLTGRGTQFQQ